jgi:uroporphyrinogen-III synthase
LIDGLRSAGARVDEVEAYRMLPRPPDLIAATWKALAPDAVVLASPFTAQTLVRSIGPRALTGLRAVVAIGPTTAAAPAHGTLALSPRAGFAEVARHLSPNGRRKSRAPGRFLKSVRSLLRMFCLV